MTSTAGSIDYRNVDYRGFIFVVHEAHGLMLLHCTRKKKKGPHFQLPGGHIDDFEFEAAGELVDLGCVPSRGSAKASIYFLLSQLTGKS